VPKFFFSKEAVVCPLRMALGQPFTEISAAV
jgi:hypothetical protein